MWYIFHGKDEFSRSEAVAQLRQKMDPVMGELNTAILDGRHLSVGELRAACDALPFMANCRLVIVHDLLCSSTAGKRPRRRRVAAGGGEDDRLKELSAYLPQLPESTRLVLSESEALAEGHPLLRLARECGGHERSFATPTGEDLERWIRQRAKAKGAGIAADALSLLAACVGPNLRLLDQEMEKLATYLGSAGTVSRKDVERLVSSVQEANVFDMVDALGSRDGRRALQLLHRLLGDGKAPLYLLTMVVRQFRLLLQARELDAKGVPAAEMSRQMEVPSFVAKKCLQQAQRFRPAELQAILAQLLDVDVGIKTGQVEGTLALDLFIVRWAGR